MDDEDTVFKSRRRDRHKDRRTDLLEEDQPEDQFLGMFIGFITGDALGSALEFSDRDSVNLITEMEKNYLYDYPVGSWTEKTSELLCMIESFKERHEFMYEDFLMKFHNFITTGYHSPNDKVFEVNYFIKTTGIKIGNCLKHRKTLPLSLNPCDYHQNDYQPLLRIAPIVARYYEQPTTCLQHVKVACQLTHISTLCVDACRFFASLMIGAFMGVNKDILVSDRFNVMDLTTYGTLKYDRLNQEYIGQCTDTEVIMDNENICCQSSNKNTFIRSLYPAIQKIQKGRYKHKQRAEIISDDLMINTLEAVLWSFNQSNSFEEGCVVAVNLGLNSSAIGAIYGQLAGIYYGYQQIPDRWVTKLQKKDYIIGELLSPPLSPLSSPDS